MPIDPQIALSVRPAEFANPLAIAMQFQQLRASQENTRSLAEQRAALAEDRAAQAEARRRANAITTGTSDALSAGGGVRDETLAWAAKNAPQSIPSLTEYFDKSASSAANIQKLQNDLNNARLDHLGHLADGVLAHGATPEALGTALALYAEQFPNEAADVQKLGEQLKSAAPEQIKGYSRAAARRGALLAGEQTKAKNAGRYRLSGRNQVLRSSDDTAKALYSGASQRGTLARIYKEFQDAKADRLYRHLRAIPERLTRTGASRS
jgi:hypothetical protein